MAIDRDLLTKALNSVSIDDLMGVFDDLGELGNVMVGSDPEAPLNQALMRLFHDPRLMERAQTYADRGGVSIENVAFPLMVGLIVGLLTPVQVEESS